MPSHDPGCLRDTTPSAQAFRPCGERSGMRPLEKNVVTACGSLCCLSVSVVGAAARTRALGGRDLQVKRDRVHRNGDRSPPHHGPGQRI